MGGCSKRLCLTLIFQGACDSRLVSVQKAKNGKFFFNLQASNGQRILSSEMYEFRAGALSGIDSVHKNWVLEASFDKLIAKDGSPYFALKAANGHIAGHSEMYSLLAVRDHGIASVIKNAADAALDDQSTVS